MCIPVRWAGTVLLHLGVYIIWCRSLWGREKIYSTKLISMHLWIATIGIVFYIAAMWVSGIMQGLMWRSYDEMGFLQYSFVESVMAMKPFYTDPRAWGAAVSERGA